MNRYQWTPPHGGLQHYGRGCECWATVMDYGSLAVLFKWTPEGRHGATWRCNSSTHATAEAARIAGSQWVALVNTGKKP